MLHSVYVHVHVLYYEAVLLRIVLKTRRLLFSKSWADEFGAQLIHLPDDNDRHISIPPKLPAHILTVGWRKHTHTQTHIDTELKFVRKLCRYALLKEELKKWRGKKKWNQKMICSQERHWNHSVNNRKTFEWTLHSQNWTDLLVMMQPVVANVVPWSVLVT